MANAVTGGFVVTSQEIPYASAKMRLFLALPPPEAWRRDTARLLGETLRAQTILHTFRLVPARNWHLTLLFFGDVTSTQVPLLQQTVQTLPATPRTPLVLDRIAFWSNARVVVLTTDRLPAAWRDYHQALIAAFQPLGVVDEKGRPWRPHLTLLRGVRACPALPELPPCRWQRPIRPLLYRSHLGRAGARYEVLG
ncbi:RNA 2',3'-cyclic phosphodiesterase [Hydrogenophilus thermoluteolus]|nr:RNA 2',3'-cyclic phosphodiesterase [Hydrogenophilus thermoluteolus]MBW7655719.1 RNA 2',3'-cyclic phosphodiesterase [Hydrogenophilus thermoluteolus]HNQ48820.1 RNA 2',3'-cyclic phosphodiesterase [Hydrogenophilus thermoluteolus]HNU19370.1 RNA 2',3'-cyclic phosphodiesterase [Hydrogenophilus thermoluteolus]